MEYKDFLSDSRVVMLPCNVGDVVYIIDFGEDEYSIPYVLDVKVLRFIIDHRGIGVELELPLGFRQMSWCVIGRNVFLTEEEAEKAMKRMEQEG